MQAENTKRKRNEAMKKTMSRIEAKVAAGLLAAVVALLAHAAMGQSEVAPATAAITNFRGEAEGYATPDVTYFQGTTILFTNCMVYTGGTTNSAVQQLDGVTVSVAIGNSTSNRTYTGSVISTNAGTWSARVVVPTWALNPSVQVKLTDSTAGTNVYIYPWKNLKSKAAL